MLKWLGPEASQMSKGLRVFLILSAACIAVFFGLIWYVHQYATHLADAGMTSTDLTSFQKYLIAASNVMKNQWFFLIPLIFGVCGWIGAQVERSAAQKIGRGISANPAP